MGYKLRCTRRDGWVAGARQRRRLPAASV